MTFNFTRKFLKEFAATNKATNLQVFGSKSSGSPVLSDNPEVLQGNSNFESGWAGATIFNPGNNTRNPIQDEWSGLNYISNYHTNYILQKGIPEYNVLTTYYIGDLCREIGGLKLYQSKTNINVGNALSDTVEWQLISILEASNIVIVNSEADFPTPAAGVITLEAGKHYLLNSFVTTANRFVFPAGDVQISSTTIFNQLVYTGGGVMFTGNAGLVIINQMIMVAPGGTFFDFDDAFQFFSFDTIWSTCDRIGDVNCDNFSCIFSTFNVFGGGITSIDRTDTDPRAQFAMIDTGMVLSTNNGTTFLDISGNLGNLTIRGGTMRGGTNETLLDFKQSLKDNNTAIVLQNCTLESDLAIFAANSLKQDYINSNFSANIGAQDSTSVCKITFENNSAVTTISVIDQNEPINVNVDYLISGLIERFVIQDVCTFENVGNTVDTLFNHGLVLNDRVFLNAYSGSTLPPELDEITEYFVINPNAADFQISLTSSGSAIDFSTDGTGPLNYRHKTEASGSRSGEMIYMGNEDIKMKVDGWIALLSVTGTAVNNSSAIMKINLDGSIVEDQFGSIVTVDNTDAQSSVDIDVIELVTGEGVVLNIRNNSNTANIIAENYVSTLTKV